MNMRHKGGAELDVPERRGEVAYSAGKVFAIRGVMLPLSEFDIGGVLYHGNYFHLYERGREEWLRRCGMPYESLVKGGRHLVVTASRQDFLKPLSYGHSIDLFLWVSNLRRASMTIQYAIHYTGQQALPYGSDVCGHSATVPASPIENDQLPKDQIHRDIFHRDIFHSASTTHALVRKTADGWRAERFTEQMTSIFRDYYVLETNS